MCAIGKCRGVWVALHGINRRILAVGGRGATGKAVALYEANWRKLKYGPPGPIPTIDPICAPMMREGPAADRIRREMRELGIELQDL
jgi:hypothetical protein